MELVIVTGLSGAGKSRTVDALEDIGFYCVDNVPPMLISKFTQLCMQSQEFARVAIVTDLRGGDLFIKLFDEFEELTRLNIEYKLLFLDCSDQVLMRRFKETRRRHPLCDVTDNSVETAIKSERKLLEPARARADYIVDTTHLSPAQLKSRITETFLENKMGAMIVNCMSFGFKYGYPVDADIVIDVRCLPNPFYVPELKELTGLDPKVRDFVMETPQAQGLMDRVISLVDYTIPLYVNEGKSQLVVAFGCTGGKHRSITFAELVYKHLKENNNYVKVSHRDITKRH